MTYSLYYWHPLPGRGEFVRLVLEHVGAAYVDVARNAQRDTDGGGAAVMKILKSADAPLPPLAPPILGVDGHLIAQTANICQFLGQRHGVDGGDEMGRAAVLQLQLTIMDLTAEAHDTHHPTSPGLTYEEQKDAAMARAAVFTADRMPKFLGYFERVLGKSDRTFLVGSEVTYADLSLFHVVRGLRYAFPNRMRELEGELTQVLRVADAVKSLPNIAAYLGSERHIPFNEMGIFRRYPELDVP